MLPFHVAHSALSKKVGGLPAQVKSIYSVPQRISTNKSSNFKEKHILILLH